MLEQRPLGCPTNAAFDWRLFSEEVRHGWAAVQDHRMQEAVLLLSDAVRGATTNVDVAHDCSVGIAAAFRVLALAHAANRTLQGLARLRALQVGLRFMHLASNWLTHAFVRHDHDVGFIEGSRWPITLQESADEHRAALAMLSQGGQQMGHRPLLPTIPDDYRHPTLSIAIVSLCAYPKGHALPAYAISNHRIYAARHGYTYHVSTERLDEHRHPAWGKIKLMQRYLEQREDGWDWIMWADCDVYFMNLSISLDSLLFRYGGVLPTLGGGTQLHAQGARTDAQPELDPGFHFLITEDHAMLNTGIFLARSSQWSILLMRRVWGPERSAWSDHPWWEQAAMSWDFWETLPERFREADHLAWAASAEPGADGMEGVYPPEVRLAPQCAFNSYHPITSRFVADTWSPGKFVIAFNGVVSSSSPNVAAELYGSYYELFCKLNHVQHLCIHVGNLLPWL